MVIGGAAAALAYGATRSTEDIDTFHPLSSAVQRAVEEAQRSTGLNIPVSFAAVADAPYDFEDRLVSIPGLALERLTIVVPERHDLVLMKTLRGYQHDVEVIEQIHRGHLSPRPTGFSASHGIPSALFCRVPNHPGPRNDPASRRGAWVFGSSAGLVRSAAPSWNGFNNLRGRTWSLIRLPLSRSPRDDEGSGDIQSPVVRQLSSSRDFDPGG